MNTQDIIGAGQKSGIYSAFDPDTGDFLWGTQVGPGGDGGGIQWGSATDGERIYVAIANSNHQQSAAGTAGSWSALDPTDGEILWQIPDPNGAQDIGPMTVANGVVYAPSTGAATASTANMFALDAATGKVLWSFPSGGVGRRGRGRRQRDGVLGLRLRPRGVRRRREQVLCLLPRRQIGPESSVACSQS